MLPVLWTPYSGLWAGCLFLISAASMCDSRFYGPHHADPQSPDRGCATQHTIKSLRHNSLCEAQCRKPTLTSR